MCEKLKERKQKKMKYLFDRILDLKLLFIFYGNSKFSHLSCTVQHRICDLYAATMEFTDTGKYTANGRDEAEFLISTNPGEPLKPLGKVASGASAPVLSRFPVPLKVQYWNTLHF